MGGESEVWDIPESETIIVRSYYTEKFEGSSTLLKGKVGEENREGKVDRKTLPATLFGLGSIPVFNIALVS